MRIDNPMRVPWWLWPNVLNLDAPLITLVWQELFARAAGVTLTLGERAALFLAVFVIYATDRVIDGIRLRVSEEMSHRHRFSHDHARPLVGAILCAVAVELWLLATAVPVAVTLGGLAVGGVVAVYFAWNHLAGERLGRGWFKELVVSFVFAAGAGLVPFVYQPSWSLAADIATFAVVCIANCILIARIEHRRDLARGEVSIARIFPPDARPARVLAIGVAVVLLGAILAGTGSPARVGALGAAVLIASAGWVERAAGGDAATVWADLALALGGILGIAAEALTR